MILCVSVVSVVMSPLLFWFYLRPLFFLVGPAKGFSILFLFKEPTLHFIDISNVFLVAISTLIFISFLHHLWVSFVLFYFHEV